MKIMNLTRSALLADNAVMADSFLVRIKGLLGRETLNKGEALILKPCNSIHTFFMHFAIDALFVSRDSKIIGLMENTPPFRISRIYPQAHFVIELPPATISNTHTQFGDIVHLGPAL